MVKLPPECVFFILHLHQKKPNSVGPLALVQAALGKQGPPGFPGCPSHSRNKFSSSLSNGTWSRQLPQGLIPGKASFCCVCLPGTTPFLFPEQCPKQQSRQQEVPTTPMTAREAGRQTCLSFCVPLLPQPWDKKNTTHMYRRPWTNYTIQILPFPPLVFY